MMEGEREKTEERGEEKEGRDQNKQQLDLKRPVVHVFKLNN